MKLKPLFKKGTGGEIDNAKLIQLLKRLGEETPQPQHVEENRETFLGRTAGIKAERETS